MKKCHSRSLRAIGMTLAIAILSASPALTATAAKIDFDLNGVAPVVHTAESTGSVKIPTIELDFDNMSFEGWNTSPTGSGRSYKAGDTVSSNTTLYAQWADGTSGDPDDPDPDPDPDPNPDPDPDQDYAELSDLRAITITLNGVLLHDFDPLVSKTYTVPSGTTITLTTNGLNMDIWDVVRTQPNSSTVAFTMTGKTQSGNNLVVTYTFKAEQSDPDPDPGTDDDYAKASDLETITVTVNGEKLDSFDPMTSGTYTIPAGAEVNLDASRLNKDYWVVNKTETDESVVYSLIGTGQNNQVISVTYEFVADTDDNDNPNTPSGSVDKPNADGDDQFTGITGNIDAGADSADDTSNAGSQPGSPTAGFIDITNIKTAAPLTAIIAGALAVLAVLLLTSRGCKKASNRRSTNRLTRKISTFFTTLAHNKAYLAIVGISAITIICSMFYLTALTTNAANSDYVDKDGEPYNGYVTIVDESGNTASNITTWWLGGVKQTGEGYRNGHWHYFNPSNDGIMVRSQDISHTASISLAITDPNNTVDHSASYTFRYYASGNRAHGESANSNGEWFHFDESTGIMTKGWHTLAPNDDFNFERRVCYNPQTGVMIKGGVMIDPTMTDPSQYGSLYEFDPVNGNATWHIPNLVDTQLTGKYPEQPSSSYPGDRRQRVLYAALSRVGARYDGDRDNIPNVFVCDGLTAWAYTHATGEINQASDQNDIGPADYQWELIEGRGGIVKDVSQLKPGDLIFWGADDTLTKYPGALSAAGWPGYHAAIYYNNGQMIHSSTMTGHNGVGIDAVSAYPVYTYLGGGSPYVADTSQVPLPD